jgi:hypothetical protein
VEFKFCNSNGKHFFDKSVTVDWPANVLVECLVSDKDEALAILVNTLSAGEAYCLQTAVKLSMSSGDPKFCLWAFYFGVCFRVCRYHIIWTHCVLFKEPFGKKT